MQQWDYSSAGKVKYCWTWCYVTRGGEKKKSRIHHNKTITAHKPNKLHQVSFPGERFSLLAHYWIQQIWNLLPPTCLSLLLYLPAFLLFPWNTRPAETLRLLWQTDLKRECGRFTIIRTIIKGTDSWSGVFNFKCSFVSESNTAERAHSLLNTSVISKIGQN